MEEPCKCPPEGLPAWMGTFADLMSLLMCFFVLLLAFSEMDVMKFKQIAGSMKYAFGVQNLLEVKDIPKGTSVIAQEFRPGRPEPTPIETIMQQTIDMTQAKLDFQDGESDSVGGKQQDQGQKDGGLADTRSDKSENEEKQQAAQNQLAKTIAHKMREQIEDGAIEIEALGQQLVIRVRERGAFPSGSAFLQPKFRPVIRQIADILKDVPGKITVSGHSDNENIKSELYQSNWDLSTQRAVAVAHEMIKVKDFEDKRLMVVGYADTQPLFENNDPANRRKNRRVEISVMQGEAQESDTIEVVK
ncbi:flagellar motor protein MotB [Motilimonas pumila]|uniref:Flagellar motor protein MotB n=1 Tax=Motilimonas pumila TaxID=2303987 RepID=A0A418YKR2_9GAMM|nr:flagellar motor protein MotB [Motilimonas pumila]RJG51539.1 flagellar motor protein MotB [Motilimonas pumila]